MFPKKKFLIAVAIPVLILLSMTVKPLLAIMLGEEIYLETRPVDPRDIFRGDYVRLSYKIEEIPLEKFPEEIRGLLASDVKDVKEVIKNRILYGVLKDEGNYSVIDYVTLEKPEGRLYLRGKVSSYYPFLTNTEKVLSPVQITVDFGLDKYFVPENTGKELEDQARKGGLKAQVKVFAGYGLLTDLKGK